MSTTAKFPADFFFGYATASAQVEGFPNADNKSPSIWDKWSHDPSHIKDGKTVDAGTGFYEKWREDIALMKSYGVNAYRMSLSWPRIVPSGKKGGEVNTKAIAWYREVLEELKANGITPFVTIWHWDMPQSLLDEYGGWLSRKMIVDFEYYSRVCFEKFGDLVENWFTINEPNIHAMHGYKTGQQAPGRSSDRRISPEGDSSVEHLIVGHHLLLAHATVVKLYRDEFKKGNEKRQIALVVNANWGEPMDDTPESIHAAQMFFDCNSGWFSDPIVFGDYPQNLKDVCGDKLPVFTDEEKALVKGSTDFIAMNHYTTMMVKKRTTPLDPSDQWNSFVPDIETSFLDKNGVEIAPEAGLIWCRTVPWGFGKLLDYMWKRYQLPIYISENGITCPNENDIPMEEALHDDFRIDYFTRYCDQMALKISEGVPIKSYLAWAFTDNYEWQEGYSARFGVTYIDYEDGLKRYPKDSAWALKKYFEERTEKA